MTTEMVSVSDVILKAGGAMVVAQKLGYSIHTVLAWSAGRRRPTKKGNVRSSLCKLAGVPLSDVTWERTIEAAGAAKGKGR